MWGGGGMCKNDVCVCNTCVFVCVEYTSLERDIITVSEKSVINFIE